MRNLSRRITQAEKKLNLDKDSLTVVIACYGDGELPPDRTQGNINIRYEKHGEQGKKQPKSTKNNQFSES